ncbi:CoA transferase [Alkalihalophilus pseudofirmus]|uniref:CaiB/BaiF CoA transferase family protein n=1 Tax=Alkalihalophilus pseudofirmus TaxID=79885 RepID=UPI000950D7C3|nr:CoA transferase [Alkalihalophilus pseudofirmus]
MVLAKQGMLDSIKIIDFTNYLPGPFASLRLGNMGAQVIKVEPPHGDPARHLSTMHEGVGVIYAATNWNKQSIHLNLKDPADQERALQLIKNADVVIESFRPGVMEKFGLHYERLKEMNPGLIYCSISGYGQHTDHQSGFGSHDINYMAESGILSLLSDENGKPVHPHIQFADYMGGMYASEQILAALVSRGVNGYGQYVDISLVDALFSMLGAHELIYRETGRTDGVDELNGQYVCYSIYETKDGRYMAIGALEQKFWSNFCTAVHQPNWRHRGQDRRDEVHSIASEVTALFKSRTLDEWTQFAKKVDCCLSPVLTINEAVSSPLIHERGLIEMLTEERARIRTSPANQPNKRKERSI